MRAIGGIVIKDKEILIVEDPQQGWLFPGGKPEENETDEECLKREFSEELSETKISNINFYKNYESQSTKHNRKVKVSMYFVDMEDTNVFASAEIKQAVFTSTPEKQNLIPTAKQIINDLRKEGYL
jgi:8-oxo-dGTP diphosphatase